MTTMKQKKVKKSARN